VPGAAAVFLPLALLALIARRRDSLAQLCDIWVGGLWLFHGLIPAQLRYKFPLAPMMFALAVVGVSSLVRRVSTPAGRNQQRSSAAAGSVV
jgi:hypothetical protein